MRKCIIFLLFWASAFPAMAAKTMSVDQLEQLLIKLHGKPDGKVAGELEDVQLTERVSPGRRARWEVDYPGLRTQEELMKLADTSVFLNPPPDDVLRDPPPDTDTQQRMVSLALEYARTAMVQLPDFDATRETTHFEDTLSHRARDSHAESVDEQAPLSRLPVPTSGVGNTAEYRTLHSTGETNVTVMYRNGHEVLVENSGNGNGEAVALGLTSSGEFGPIPEAVIGDIAESGASWLRWEQGNGEPAAVLHYAVPANQSHFRIRINAGGKEQALYPAYHGEIEIDPATGEILRLSEVADPAPPYAAVRAAFVVEYAPVTIGSQSFICPVRGVALSAMPAPGDDANGPVQTDLDDIAFTHYRPFRPEAHLVEAGNGTGGATAPAVGGVTEPGPTQPVNQPQ